MAPEINDTKLPVWLDGNLSCTSNKVFVATAYITVCYQNFEVRGLQEVVDPDTWSRPS